MDYIVNILHDENETINCRRVNECGDIDFYGYVAELLQELSDYIQEVNFITDIIKNYIDKEYQGDTAMFLSDVSHCCDYYSLTDFLKRMLLNKGS